MIPLFSAQRLAWQLGIPLVDLRKLAREIQRHYRDFPLMVDRAKGKVRMLKVPDTELRSVQRRILKRVLAAVPLSENLHGGVSGQSPKTNASQHLGQSLVVNLDVR